MIASAPLQDLNFGEWLTTLKDNGVSEHFAMELYKDMRTFGAVVFRAEPVDEPCATWDQFRAQMCGVLKSLTTQEQAKEYLKNPLKMMYEATGQEFVDESTKIAVAKMLTANPHSRQAMGGRSDIIDWLVSSVRSRIGDLTLTWNDVHAAISHDIPQVDAASKVGNSEQLLEQAAQVLHDCGLNSFQWPAVVGLAPKTGGQIVQAIATTNSELQKRTQWDGGVLGLNKTVHLQIGQDTTGSGGYCQNIDAHTTFICSSPATPTNVLAHEWFHALDYKLSNTGDMLSEHNETENPQYAAMKKLIDSLNSYQSSEHLLDNTALISALRSNLERNWVMAGYPEGISDHLNQCLDEAPTSLSPQQYKQQFQRLKTFLADNNFPRTLDLHATILMTDLAVVRDSTQLLNEGQSLWIAFAQRFKDNVTNHLKDFKNYAGYFLEHSEQLAHSFEITSDGTNIGFIDPNQNMRYPTAPEQTAQKLHWKRFFASTKQWWDQERGVSAQVDTSLKDRIAKKRVATDVSSALPIAAKP